MAIPLMVNTPGPVLVSTTGCGALLVFTTWFPNAKFGGDRLEELSA
jgi:hypothetical protein